MMRAKGTYCRSLCSWSKKSNHGLKSPSEQVTFIYRITLQISQGLWNSGMFSVKAASSSQTSFEKFNTLSSLHDNSLAWQFKCPDMPSTAKVACKQVHLIGLHAIRHKSAPWALASLIPEHAWGLNLVTGTGSNYIYYLEKHSNTLVGFVQAIQGICIPLGSFPGGYLADRNRRDGVLRVFGVIGFSKSLSFSPYLP